MNSDQINNSIIYDSSNKFKLDKLNYIYDISYM
jgi:hypothetical protein